MSQQSFMVTLSAQEDGYQGKNITKIFYIPKEKLYIFFEHHNKQTKTQCPGLYKSLSVIATITRPFPHALKETLILYCLCVV